MYIRNIFKAKLICMSELKTPKYVDYNFVNNLETQLQHKIFNFTTPLFLKELIIKSLKKTKSPLKVHEKVLKNLSKKMTMTFIMQLLIFNPYMFDIYIEHMYRQS